MEITVQRLFESNRGARKTVLERYKCAFIIETMIKIIYRRYVWEYFRLSDDGKDGWREGGREGGSV